MNTYNGSESEVLNGTDESDMPWPSHGFHLYCSNGFSLTDAFFDKFGNFHWSLHTQGRAALERVQDRVNLRIMSNWMETHPTQRERLMPRLKEIQAKVNRARAAIKRDQAQDTAVFNGSKAGGAKRSSRVAALWRT